MWMGEIEQGPGIGEKLKLHAIIDFKERRLHLL